MAVSVVKEYEQKLTRITDALVQDPSIDKDLKVKLIIHSTALICAIVAVQPIPFADLFILTPIQLIMVTSLNRILGNPFEKSSANEILVSLLGIVGWGTLAQQLILGAYKTVVPFLGGVTTIPLVYAATFALGMAAKVLIVARKNDQEISNDTIKAIFKKAKAEAELEQKKLSISDALQQIEQLFKSTDEYTQYKFKLLTIESKIREAFFKDVATDIDVNRFITVRKEYISERLKKYSTVFMNDFIISMFSVINSNDFIEKIEPVISDLNFNYTKMKRLSERPFEKGKFVELETEIGVVLIRVNSIINTIEIIDINLKEEFLDNSLLEYLSQSKNSDNILLKDGSIRESFHQLLQDAKNYVYIVSPWVGDSPFDDVVNILQYKISTREDFEVKVVYGYGKNAFENNNSNYKSNTSKFASSRENIDKYKQRLGDRFATLESDTHVKLLIVDDDCYLIGSMNFLSFNGVYNPTTRHEVSILSFDREMLHQLKDAYFNW